MGEFKYSGVLWRMLFALVPVLVTFNPTGHSCYYWLVEAFLPCSRSSSSQAWCCSDSGCFS
jgi:hypothetical protein